MNYAVYLPDGYESKSNWPVMVFFHGVGECENGTTSAKTVAEGKGGPIHSLVDQKFGVGMVIIQPRLPQNGCDWLAAKMDKFVTAVLPRFKVDTDRLYITGLSLGGRGTARYLSSYSGKVAAAISICPAGGFSNTTPSVAEQMVANDVPLWTAVAANDGTVDPNHAFTMIVGIWKALGGSMTTTNVKMDFPGSTATAYFDANAKVHRWMSGQDYRAGGQDIAPAYLVTYYSSGGHGIWDRMFHDPKIYDWLLKFTRDQR